VFVFAFAFAFVFCFCFCFCFATMTAEATEEFEHLITTINRLYAKEKKTEQKGDIQRKERAKQLYSLGLWYHRQPQNGELPWKSFKELLEQKLLSPQSKTAEDILRQGLIYCMMESVVSLENK